MAIKLYDLAGADDDRRFSPYCWRVKMALAQKSLDYETIPWRMTEKETIAFSGQGLVPVMLDGERKLHDSWSIANYLDEAYPNRPRLFGGAEARSLTLFLKHWCERGVHPPMMRVIVMDLFNNLHEKDKAYFRESREKRYGKTLEEVGADRNGAIAALRTALDPARQLLTTQEFLSGKKPGFADYILFGNFQWARVMSPARLLEPDDPVYTWRERLLDLYGGLARAAKGYPVLA